ncbi:MAG: RagB/SusD family nutrient uptake outer membrane protein, partial [Chitinophagaceae bacterium]
MKQLKYIKILLTVFVLFIASCNKDILNYKDQNSYSAETYFNTPSEIEKGATAAYASFYFNNMMGFKWPEMFDVLANESEPTPGAAANEVDIMAMYKYQFNNNTNPVVGYWRMLYKMILRSNLIIDKANAFLNEKGDDAIVKRSLGEVYFLRGWAYSQLAFYYGRVPLRLTYNQAGNEDAPRANTVDEVWDVAESDFKKAKNLLPEVSSYTSKELGRATKGAATGFLGKLYLYNKEYAKAEAEFALLDGKYSLLPANLWSQNFDDKNENNNESLFEVQFSWFEGNFLWGNFADPEGSGSPSTQNAHVQLYTWGAVGGWGNWKFQTMRVNDFKYTDEANAAYTDPRAALTFYGGIGDNTIFDNAIGGPQPYDFAGLKYWYKK